MSEPVRVLHVLQRMEAAGVQTLLMSLYRAIDRTKVQFDFLVHYATPQFFDEEIQKLGGRIYRFPVREDYRFLKYYRELNEFFRVHREYNVVHGHMHSLGAIYLHAAKKQGVPVRIAHSHTNATQNDAKKIIKTCMNKLYAKDATDLFACSKAAGYYMFEKKPFKVINNAINSEAFVFSSESRENMRKELGIEDKFTVGCVGRFELQKNQSFSIEVFDRLLTQAPNAVLLLIGTGSMEQEIKELVKSKGLTDKVMFLGNRRDVINLYHAMDVFLMPSLFEGLGIVGVEAQAAGTPTVCTDTLPEELNISSLIYRVPLSERPEVWASKIVEAANNTLAHTDVSADVVAAGFDMSTTAHILEEFYISKQWKNKG